MAGGARSARFCFLLATILASLAVTSVASADPVNGENLSLGPRTTFIPAAQSQPRLKDASTERLRGTRTKDGTCSLPLRFHSEAGDTTPELARVSAVDPDTCVYEVERGTPIDMPREDSKGAVESEKDSVSARGKKEASGGEGFAPASHNDLQACYTTYWEDPPNLDVNKVRSCVRSNTTGNRIDTIDCSTRRYWLRATGWFQLEHTKRFNCELTGGRGRSESTITFKNEKFCHPTDPTYVKYIRNTAYVDLNSVDGYIDETDARGDCARLLLRYAIWEPGEYH